MAAQLDSKSASSKLVEDSAELQPSRGRCYISSMESMEGMETLYVRSVRWGWTSRAEAKRDEGRCLLISVRRPKDFLQPTPCSRTAPAVDAQ